MSFQRWPSVPPPGSAGFKGPSHIRGVVCSRSIAPGRLYRDYMLDQDSFGLPPHGTSLKLALDLAETPHAAVPDIKLDDGRLISRFHEYNAGIAQTTDEGKTTARFQDYGTGIAQSKDDDDDISSSPDMPSEPEPVLHEPLEIPAEAVPLDIDHKRTLAPSVISVSHISQDAQSSERSSTSKMPEFFTHAVFQVVLRNPTIAHQLLKFGQLRLCGENMEFLGRVNKYHASLNEVSKSIAEIHKDFISNAAPTQINLPGQLLGRLNHDMKSSLASTLPALESIFVDAQNDIERVVYLDIYPKFVRHQMSVSAAKALGGDRTKYAGLGDCFVLTDPLKADNPILYASDGFVKVTGYSRNEIIPRNCRFLQSRHTDRSAVKRLKAAIDKREESVELLLNHKKDGTPFWNLLYTTPLFDGHGNLVFFLGGQINCSTTIHSASDVLRILAQSDEDEEAATRAVTPQTTVKPPRARNLLDAFRTTSKPIVPQRAPGMEDSLLERVGDMDLRGQMKTFYTAYSNFIIINYSSFLVTFISGGFVDLLFPINAKTAYHAQGVGADIFKFLANHGSGSLSWDFKSAVKSALRMGQAISLGLKLCARPYMGFERFVLHWTPLKDEVGAVSWIVLTLGNEQRA